MPRLTITSTPIPVTFTLESQAPTDVSGALEPATESRSIYVEDGLSVQRRLRADTPAGSVYLAGVPVRMYYGGPYVEPLWPTAWSEVLVVNTDASGYVTFSLTWAQLQALGIGQGGPFAFEFWSDEVVW